MRTIDCRNDTMCLLCKYWLGERAEIDYISGKGRIEIKKGLCSNDGKNYKSTEMCRYFEKCLTYL